MMAFLAPAGSAEMILQPLFSYALMASGICLCIYLFITVKAEIRGLLRRNLDQRQRIESLETSVAAARELVQSLESELRALEVQTGMLVAPPPARSGLNLSKRTHVLRMHRAGENGAGIAAALALPRSEVELLIKVQQIAMDQI